jgi:hypothetical protein
MELVKQETALQIFNVTDAVLSDLESSTKLTIADTESEKVVRKYRQQAKSLQVQIEKRRLKLNREYKERTDKAAEILTTRINPVYDDLDGKIKAVEAEREKKRLEKEAAEKAERERLEKIEAERVEKINAAFAEIEKAALAGQRYNLPAEDIKKLHHALNNMEVSEEILQERYQEAMDLWKKGLEDTHAALIAREKFEAEQADLEAKKKRLAEEQARFEAEQKAASEAEAKKAQEQFEADWDAAIKYDKIWTEKKAAEKAEADRIWQAQEKLRLEREAFEKEKADAEAKRQAEEDQKKAAEQYLVDWDAAIAENAEFVKARKEKQKADKARAKLVKVDKELLTGFMQKIKAPVFDSSVLKTEAAKIAIWSFMEDFDAMVDGLKTNIKNLT